MSGIIGGAGSKSGVIGTTELEYEYGEWTGTISNLSYDAVMDNNTGKYIRIGNSVTVLGYFVTSSLGSIGSGDIYLKGLPFTSNSHGAGGTTYGAYLNITAGQSMACKIVANQTYFIINIWDEAAGVSHMSGTQWSDNGRIMVGATYSIN
jgi:hypothetical protein